MPFNSGAVASGMCVEPYRTIMSYAPAVYWRFDEASGTIINYGSTASRNGTMNGTPVYGAAKIPTRSPKGSMTFDGVNDYMAVTDGVITGASPIYSVGIWLKGTSSVNSTLFQQMDATNNLAGFRVYLTTGITINIEGTTTAGATDFILPFSGYDVTEVNDGDPIFISFSVDATYARLYVNGVYMTKVARAGGVYSSTSDIRIGSKYDGTEFYPGTISDAFIVTGTALTQHDWYKIYRNGMINAVSPVNDSFNEALATITGASGSLVAVVAGASLEPNEPLNPTNGEDSQNPSGVWYKIVPASTTTLSLVHDGYVMQLFRQDGSGFGGLTFLDQIYGSSAKTLYVGQTYYIRVAAYRLLAPVNVGVSWSTVTPPVNDNFAAATTVSVVSAGSIAGTTINSTKEVFAETNALSGESRSVWYKFQADTTGTITIDTQIITTVDTTIAVWTAAAAAVLGDLNFAAPYASDDDSGVLSTSLVTFAVTNGLWYYVQISDYDGGCAFTLSWSDIT